MVHIQTYDTPEQIEQCLSCARSDCTGDCARVRMARPASRSRPGPQGADIPDYLLADLVSECMTAMDVAAICGCSESAVRRRKQKYLREVAP